RLLFRSARDLLRVVRGVPLRTAIGDRHPVVSRPERGAHLPPQRRLAALVRQSVRKAGGRRFRRLVPPFDDARHHGYGGYGAGLAAGRARLSPAFLGATPLFYLAVASLVVP